MTRPRVLLATAVLAAGVAAVLALTALRAAPDLPGIARDPAPEVLGLTFLDHTDPDDPREVDLVPPARELRLVYFGYLSCPDVCPMTMVDIRRALTELGPDYAGRTSVAFVTLDPERDDGAKVRDYLAHFFEERFLPLTAPDVAALEDATDRLGVRWEIEPHDPGDDRYDVAHSAITYVVDDRGQVVRELPFGSTPDDFAQVIRGLLP